MPKLGAQAHWHLQIAKFTYGHLQDTFLLDFPVFETKYTAMYSFCGLCTDQFCFTYITCYIYFFLISVSRSPLPHQYSQDHNQSMFLSPYICVHHSLILTNRQKCKYEVGSWDSVALANYILFGSKECCYLTYIIPTLAPKRSFALVY